MGLAIWRSGWTPGTLRPFLPRRFYYMMGCMKIVNKRESLFLPPPSSVERILIWHQGALGDLLLAAPALVALSRHYPQARITGLGHPERWGLLAHSLPLAGVWDSGEAIWAHLFTDSPLPPALRDRLAPFQLALAFTPKPRPHLLERLESAGIPSAHWLPSFPVHCQESVAACQARRLAELGLSFEPQPFHLVLDQTREEDAVLDLAGPGPWVAVAPGSGHPGKNWPLSHYYELTRALAWQHGARVAWLAGPGKRGCFLTSRPWPKPRGIFSWPTCLWPGWRRPCPGAISLSGVTAA